MHIIIEMSSSVSEYPAGSFEASYQLHESIGKGAFSTVHRCRNRISSQEFAVKIIDLRPLRLSANFDSKRLMREVDIMRSISHENVIRLIEVFETEDCVKIVMEIAMGRELFDLILARNRYSEADARPIFTQIASALGFLHNKGIVHRDIKPENIIVTNHGGVVKLLDFGLAKATSATFGSTAKTFVGTPCYLAPEVENVRDSDTGYGVEVDCWSLGAVLYVMLVARFPEFERTSGVPLVKLTADIWKSISREAKDLIKGLMNPDPRKRITAQQALQHPWTLGIQNTSRPSNADDDDMSSLKNHVGGSAFVGVGSSASQILLETVPSLGDDSIGNDSETSIESLHTPGIGIPQFQHLNIHTTDDALVPIQKPRIVTATQASSTSNQSDKQSQLMLLHKKVCHLFESALLSLPPPAIASRIRHRALLARNLMVETFKVMRKLHMVSTQILKILDDTNLAVRENEPLLAHRFFSRQKDLINQLREGLEKIKSLNDNLVTSVNVLISEVGTILPSLPPSTTSTSSSSTSSTSSSTLNTTDSSCSSSIETGGVGGGGGGGYDLSLTKFNHSYQEDHLLSMDLVSPPSPPRTQNTNTDNQKSGLDALAVLPSTLHQIDKQLDNSSLLLANIDVVFEMMTAKGDLVEEYVDFAHNPSLMKRFQDRITEYRLFWNQMQETAVANISAQDHSEATNMYAFVDTEKGNDQNNSSSSTSSSSSTISGVNSRFIRNG